MKAMLSGALAGVLAAGCAATKVDPPPTPPSYRPAAAHPAAPASESVQEKTAPAAEPRLEPKTEPVSASGATAAAQSKTPDAPDARAQSSETAQAPATPERAGPERPALGWIAGKPLEAEELLLEWGDLATREMWMVLDKLVAARLAMCEAERLGIRLAPEAVEQRFAAERAKLEKEVAKSGKQGDVEQFIERELGFEPARYLERVRRATVRQMLAERAVRAASLASESVALRLIVVSNDDQKEKVVAALAGGRPFADVARELSVDDSKKNGGLVPFVVRDPRSPLAQLAFQTPVGEVAGPMPISDHQFWIRVEERRAPTEGNWSAIEGQVEASLAAAPVDNAEFVHWRLTMEGRYPIDLGPLWSLIGAAK
jgi:hypothetical protein